MARRPRRNHGSAFRAKASAAVIEGEETLIELAQDPDVHPNQIERWRDQFLVGRLHVAALSMGIAALHRKPSTSEPAPGHGIYPYLLPELPRRRRRNTARPRSSTRIVIRLVPVLGRSEAAWMASEPGATTSSSDVYGEA